MNVPFHIAKKYFGNYLKFNKKHGKKSWNAIQILTAISVVTALIISLAAVIILSVFNGLTFLLGDLNAVFYPELKVEPTQAKVFSITENQLNEIKSLEEVQSVSKVLEEIALIDNNQRQKMGIVKGVDEEYSRVSNIEEGMFRGNFQLRDGEENFAVVGLGISNDIALNTSSPFAQISLFIPQRKKRVSFGPASLLGKLTIKPSGEFAIQKEFDDQYVFVPYEALRPLLQYTDDKVSYLELKLSDERKSKSAKRKIKEILGNDVIIKNREQQNESWYKVMRFEKWMSFAILVVIMLIASFNLLSSLTMMVLDKRKDISILKSMGLENSQVASLFRWQGLLIGLAGAVLGTGIASIIVLAQQQFGFIPLQGSFVVDSYPIQLKLFDVIVTIIAIVLISWLASILPAQRAKRLFVKGQ